MLQTAQKDGFDWGLKMMLQEQQVLLVGALAAGIDFDMDRTALLKFLISYCLVLAILVNLWTTMLLRNQTAALEESGMMWLPWIWTLRLEWWRCTLVPPRLFRWFINSKDNS